MNTGICTAVLRGHSSLVKGVVWDPIGSFVASQSDDKTVLIWRTSDWTLAHRTDGHWAKSLGSTFFRRLGWSPCGHFITTTHGFQKPRHSAPVLERGEWSATFDFLGHNAPVIVVKFNNSLFRRNSSNNEEATAALGWTNVSSKTGGKDLTAPYNVIAIGSQDRTITVWTTASPRPLFVAKHFFSQSVVDLSWSPDGYSLFACSLDGTVATFHFDVNELGQRLTETELDELKKNRYGDVRGRQANLAESPAQLLLEAAAAKQQTPSKKAATDVHASKSLLKSSANSRGSIKVSKSQIEDRKKIEGGTGGGLTKAAPSVAPSARRSSPVKQREYRRPDGRKRIIPEAVGVPAQRLSVLSGADFPCNSFDHLRDENRGTDSGIMEASLKKTAGGISETKEHSGITAKATISENLVIEKVSSSNDKDGCISIEQAGFVKHSDSPTVDILAIRIFGKKEAQNAAPVCLEAHPIEHAVNDIVGIGGGVLMKETKIVCFRGTQTLWSDRISGKVTVLAGNVNFWAVGCEDGSLQIYTKCGRRALPTMMIGSAAIFIDCDEAWKLLLVTRKGSLYVWDIFNKICLLENSLTSLISSDPKSIARDAGSIKIISAKLSRSGSPLVTLATRQAYLFDMRLRCWLSVADDCLPASSFASSCNLGSVHGGELAALHADVGKFLTRKPAWSKVTDDAVYTRAHLEAQLASAQSLKSPNEYRQCLLSYVRFLAREADESRLREICESFLGPPIGMVETTVEATAWDPFILGMRKHKLLKEDILPAIASNRKVQRLLNEFIDLISEYEMTEAMQEEKRLAPPTSSQKEITANMNSDLHRVDASSTTGLTITDPLDSTATRIDRAGSVKPVKEQIDLFLQETDQAEPMNLDQPALDPTNPA